ncbi:hypothetical protein [Porphyromonas macacae]|nr:hypothetical protein [Porphyromonas macacae]
MKDIRFFTGVVHVTGIVFPIEFYCYAVPAGKIVRILFYRDKRIDL